MRSILIGWMCVFVSATVLGVIHSAQAQDAETPNARHVDYVGDRLPDGALARLGSARLQIHGPAVFLPNRDVLIAADQDIHFLDFEGKERMVLSGGRSPYQFLAVSTDGKVLAAFGADHTVRVVDTATGKDLATLSYDRFVHQAAFIEGGRFLLTAEGLHDQGGRTMVRLRDVASGKDVWSMPGRTFALSPDRTVLASFGVPHPNLRIHDVKTGRERISTSVAGNELAWSPDGKYAALSGWFDHAVRIWDTAAKKVVREFDGGRGPVSFSSDSKSVAFWDYADGRDRMLLADVATGKEVVSFGKHALLIEFTPDGGTALAPSRNSENRLAFWDTKTWKERFLLPGRATFGSALVCPTGESSFSSDGKTLVTADSTRIHLWNTATGQERTVPPGHPGGTLWAEFDRTGKQIISAGRDGTLLRRDIASGKILAHLSGKGRPAALSADQKLAAWLDDGTLIVRDIEKDLEVRRWKDGAKSRTAYFGHEAVAFSPDGTTLAWGTIDNPILLLDIQSGKQLHSLEGHETRGENLYVLPSGILSLRFAPDSKTLLSAGADQDLRLWDVSSGKGQIVRSGMPLTRPWQSSDQPVWISGGRRLLMQKAESNNSPTKVERDFVLVDVAEAKESPSISKGSAYAVTISPDGTTVAWVDMREGRRDRIVLTNLSNGKEMYRFSGHQRPIHALAYSRDGSRLASASEDGTVLIWDLENSIQRPR